MVGKGIERLVYSCVRIIPGIFSCGRSVPLPPRLRQPINVAINWNCWALAVRTSLAQACGMKTIICLSQHTCRRRAYLATTRGGVQNDLKTWPHKHSPKDKKMDCPEAFAECLRGVCGVKRGAAGKSAGCACGVLRVKSGVFSKVGL